MTEFFTAVKLSLKKTVLCDSLEEWDGVEGGKEDREREHMYTNGWFTLLYR